MIRFVYLRCLLLTFSLLLGGPSLLQAQFPNLDITRGQAQDYLEQRGLTDEEVLDKLRERGYDVNNLSNLSVAQYAQLERDIEEILDEIEAEQAAASRLPGAPGDSIAFGEEAVLPPTERDTTPEISPELDSTLAEIEEEILDSVPPARRSDVFGRELFRDNSMGLFNRGDFDRPPPNYILKEGDEVSVAIFGLSEASNSYEIQPGGFIQPTGMGRIFLEGLTFREARELLRRRFRQYYTFTPEEFAVTLTFNQDVAVNIVGEVERPGSYTLSGLNTTFNALIAAGGPNKIGSVRKIGVVDAQGGTRQFDVYEFLFNPTQSKAEFLASGSYIVVPTAGPIVRITGAIKRPMRYEMLDTETLGDLIEYSGGFAPGAYQKVIQVERYSDVEKEIIDVDREGFASFRLEDGDIVTVRKVNEYFEDVVTISGDIDLAGKYDLTKSMRLADLLKRAGLRESSRLDLAYLIRQNDDGTTEYKLLDLQQTLSNPADNNNNPQLQRGDQVKIFSQKQFVNSDSLFVVGAVREPLALKMDLTTSLDLKGAIALAGGTLEQAVDLAHITRRLPSYPDSSLFFRIDLSGPRADNFQLFPGDRVRILDRRTFAENATVSIDGAVRDPNTFAYASNMTLQDLIVRANGFRFGAEPDRIDIYRIDLSKNPVETKRITFSVQEDLLASEGDFIIEPYDRVYVRYRDDFTFQEFIQLDGEVAYPGSYAITNPNETVVDIIERAGGLTAEAYPAGATMYRSENNVGYVALDLQRAIKRPGSQDNLVLKRGDIITIPKTLELVTIEGAVNIDEITVDRIANAGKISAPFYRGKRARFYINEYAGGTSEQADRANISVTYPNGRIRKTKNFGLFKITPKVTPGSTVFVPREPVKTQEELEEEKPDPVNWGQVAANIIGQATSFISLILLLSRAN